MTLIEALERLKMPGPEGGRLRRVRLACGFTPLHLETFAAAHMRVADPTNQVVIETGDYGDLAVQLETMACADLDTVLVVIEWADLDPRLGIRALGGWRPDDLTDILGTVRGQADRLAEAIGRIAATAVAVVAMPTLPIPPLFSTRSAQAGAPEMALRGMVATLGATLAAYPRVRMVCGQTIDTRSPLAERFDPRSALAADFPYKLRHASFLAGTMSELASPPAPKKGVITDLDDTLWAGLLGEIGVDGIAWSLEQGAQLHGLYQQLLASLAAAGVLVGVASKNDLGLVEQAFGRRDLTLGIDAVFPIAAGWARKSQSVGQILEAWNIGPDAVVFIDDSPMEVAEVRSAFPEMECLIFPTGDARATFELLHRLRDLCGKTGRQKEDALRLASLRAGEPFRLAQSEPGGASDGFLRAAAGALEFELDGGVDDTRAFELINKTNQFNLNGRGLGEAAWRHHHGADGAFMLTVSYRDKFGDLGKIGALLGRVAKDEVYVDAWVLSCRAFSRRIEHHCIKALFDHFSVKRITFDFVATPRNGPIQSFLAGLTDLSAAKSPSFSREGFFARAPAMFHSIA